MEQTEKKRDFKMLAEKIAPDNVLITAELLAIKETKTLVKFMGQHAIRAHATLCTDVFCKDMPDYTRKRRLTLPLAIYRGRDTRPFRPRKHPCLSTDFGLFFT